MSTIKFQADYKILKAARTYLEMDQPELAKAAGLNTNTIVSLEAGKPAFRSTQQAVQQALELRGIVFSEGSPGFTHEADRQVIPVVAKKPRVRQTKNQDGT